MCRVPPSWKNKIKKGTEISSQAQPIHVESQKTTGRNLEQIQSYIDQAIDLIQPYLTQAEEQIEEFVQGLGWSGFNIPDDDLTDEAGDVEEQVCSYIDLVLNWLPETENDVELFLSLGFLGSILALVCSIVCAIII